MKGENKRNLMLGIGTFVILSFILYFLVKPMLFESLGLNEFAGINYIGGFLCAVGVLCFLYERWNSLPFFYGRCQQGGSNANSFVVLAVGIVCFRTNVVTFMVLLAVAIVFMVIAGYLVEQAVSNKSMYHRN